MDLIVPFKPQMEFSQAPEGAYPAICFSVAYLGTQPTTYMGEPKLRKMLRIGFELHCEKTMDDGRPFGVSKEFTFSSHPKGQLRPFIESWRGKAYSDDELENMGGLPVGKLIGQPCYLNIGHEKSKDGKKIYSNIMSIMPLPKGVQISPQFNESVIYSVDQHDDAVFAKLPEYVQNKIKNSIEWQERSVINSLHEPLHEHDYDEVPAW